MSGCLRPHGLYSPAWILQARILELVAFTFSRRSSQPRDQTQVSWITGGFFTSWTTGKPKNTGVGSLSLLQGIFLTQELNQGLLHCRQLLYQLSYQRSPTCNKIIIVKMMGSNRNFCLSRDVLQINFLTMEKGTLVVCVVVAVKIRVCSTRKRQEWVRMWWCHVEKCKFALQNSLLLTDLCGIHPSRVMGPALVFTWRIWPVTALHLVLRCHAALLLQKSHRLWRFLP